MQPEIVDRPEMILAGIVATSTSVSELDIAGLWDRFIEQCPNISNQVNEEKGYELHIEEERSPKIHFCLIGVEVRDVEELPIEIFYKVVPAGKYAVYTPQFSDGGYGQAFKVVYDWLEESAYQSAYAFDIQVYDDRFKGSDDPDSILEILIPVIQK